MLNPKIISTLLALSLVSCAPASAMSRPPSVAKLLPKPNAAVTQPAVAVAVVTTQPALVPTPTLTPYTAFAWHAPTQHLAHVVGTVWYTAGSDPTAVAAILKTLPLGGRALGRWQSTELLDNPADRVASQRVPWIPAGSAAEAAFEANFLGQLHNAGASVDYLVLDTEWGISTWTCSPQQLVAIEADPRWPALCTTYKIDPANLPIGTLYGTTPQFDVAMQVTIGAQMHAAFDAPLVAQYPAAHCSDYNDVLISTALAPQAPDLNGCVQPASMPLHGDTQAPSFYGQPGNISLPGNASGQNADWSRAMTTLCWEVSAARAYAQGGAPVVPWVAGKTWAGSRLANSPWYDELVFHLLLSTGSTNLTLWDADPTQTQTDCSALDQDLAAVQAAAGGSATLTPITTAAVPYSSTTLVSGTSLQNGHKLFRVTATSQPTTQSVSVTLPGDAAAMLVTIPSNQTGTWLSR